MCQGVLPQTAQLSEPLLTEAAVEGSLLGVTSVVGGQFALIPQHLATATALQPEDKVKIEIGGPNFIDFT